MIALNIMLVSGLAYSHCLRHRYRDGSLQNEVPGMLTKSFAHVPNTVLLWFVLIP